MHSTSNLQDGYIGSGKRLRYAIRRYGFENFKFEILEWCKDRTSLINKEKEIITQQHLLDENCYNLKLGGLGGGKFYSKEHQYKCSQAAGIKHRKMLECDENYRKKISISRTETNKKNHSNGRLKSIQQSYSWVGKKHKEETKKKISEKNLLNHQGQKNSQFGTKWITNGLQNKKIKSSDSLPQDWIYGRV